jgi:hypothetical protein
MMAELDFLTSPLSFAVDLPSWVDPEPEAAGTISAFEGSRSIVYTPYSQLAEGAIPEWRHLYNLERGGATIGLYDRLGDPPQCHAAWHLSRGRLATFMNEPTATLTALETVIYAVDVIDRSPIPQLALRPPVSTSLRDAPEYADVLTFLPAPDADQSLVLTFTAVRGPFFERTSVSELDGRVRVTRVKRPGVRVAVDGPADALAHLKRLSSDVAQSVA